MYELGMQGFVELLGRNVIDQLFTFVNYIVNKYYTFAAFDLINIYGLIVGGIAFLKSKKSLDKNV